MKNNMFVKVTISLAILVGLLFFLEKLRKTILPNHYYIWEEKIKERLAQCLKENINFVLLITLFFTFLFVFLLYVGLKPWYSVWVLLLGILFIFLYFRKITILEKMYLSVLTSSIVPTLILARLIFIECFFFLAEVLGNVWPVQQKMLLSVVTTLLVFPEGSAKKFVQEAKAIFNLGSWQKTLGLSENVKREMLDHVKKQNSQLSEEERVKVVTQRWGNILKNFAIKESAMHHAKLSNLVKINGNNSFLDYKYNTVLAKFLQTSGDVVISDKQSRGLISLLNSSEVTDFITKLKEERKEMGSKEFTKNLDAFLTKLSLPSLTKEETNLLFSMLFTKAATDELPKFLLKKGSLDILYDGAKGTFTEKVAGNAGYVSDLLRYRGSQFKEDLEIKESLSSIFNADAYMKLIKEQYGLALKEKELAKRGLTILDVQRGSSLDYEIKVSNGEYINLECKSITPEKLHNEIKHLQSNLKDDQTIDFYWENTRTWEKTIFKVTKNDYTEIYKEAPEKT